MIRYFTDDAGGHRYAVDGGNGENLVTSEAYTRARDAQRGLRTLKQVLGDDTTDGLQQVKDAISHAQNEFNRYAKLHREKATPEGDEKADHNAAMAQKMAQAFDIIEARLPNTPVTAHQR